MRNTLRLWLALLVAMLGQPSAHACEKSLRWNDDPPFSMRLPDGRIGGLTLELTESALRRMGCSVRLVEMPFARALAELEAGRLDVINGVFKRPEREAYAHFSAPVLRSRNMLFMRRDELARWPFKRLSELRHSEFRLGAQIGVVYGPDYAELLADTDYARRILQVGARRNLWQMLDLERIDGLVADEWTGRFELAALGLQQRIAMTGVVVSDEPAATAFSRRSTDAAFVERFDATIAAMRRDGSLATITQRYLGKP